MLILHFVDKVTPASGGTPSVDYGFRLIHIFRRSLTSLLCFGPITSAEVYRYQGRKKSKQQQQNNILSRGISAYFTVVILHLLAKRQHTLCQLKVSYELLYHEHSVTFFWIYLNGILVVVQLNQILKCFYWS